MVLAACDSGGGSGGLVTQLKAKGVQVVIGFTRTINGVVAAWWCDLFWKYYTQGKDANPLQYMNPASAATHAHDDTMEKYGGNIVGNFLGSDPFLDVR